MCSPAMPAQTVFTDTPAIRSASTTARRIEPTVSSRFTTTPRAQPVGRRHADDRRPSGFPRSSGSAITTEILVVPMSSPT
jgi:hypothetical protein